MMHFGSVLIQRAAAASVGLWRQSGQRSLQPFLRKLRGNAGRAPGALLV